MLYRVWNFVRRHKKKIVFGAIFLIGGRYFYHYIGKKLKDFQNKEAAECLEYARRQHHFDNNQRTCNMTVLSMLPTLRERLRALLNTEEITENLKSSPADKVQLWEDLKILSLTRVITVVYACTMMCLMLRVQLNIIGGYMFVENVKKHQGMSANAAMHVAPTPVQEKYLALIREFFDKGVVSLVSKVKEAVYKETSSLTLKEKLSLHNLEAIIKHIRERVENGQEVSIKEISTLPLSELLVCWKTSDEDKEPSDDLYCQLLKETQDILYSHDFHTVFSTALDRGFAKLVDYLAEFYQPLQKTETSVIQLHDVSVPLAKLIPFLSGLLYKLGSDAPNPLVQELLLLEQTKTLAANIYEAFSQIEETDDPQP
ncbi:peroxisomal biogenesis factor 3-like [Ruditapes philippinarum]|uniref:peroxisomal biogenesis factor 3-like n=1 Tax=Ruditapes philippinarum TaxID=129788 RepID=UPI00295B169E|nr:peroxisomal biogenesis factor 3-like [Ruditapes philippinarum]